MVQTTNQIMPWNLRKSWATAETEAPSPASPAPGIITNSTKHLSPGAEGHFGLKL